MIYVHTEAQLVEEPIIGLFGALGWQSVSAQEETFGAVGTLGREIHSLCRSRDLLPPRLLSGQIAAVALSFAKEVAP